LLLGDSRAQRGRGAKRCRLTRRWKSLRIPIERTTGLNAPKPFCSNHRLQPFDRENHAPDVHLLMHQLRSIPVLAEPRCTVSELWSSRGFFCMPALRHKHCSTEAARWRARDLHRPACRFGSCARRNSMNELNNVRPNTSIERTCSGALRAPTHAAHVER
jgi:hypothetical protein